MQFQIYSQLEGLFGTQWRWRLVALNGKTIASGEGYHNREDCVHAVSLVMDTNRQTPFVAVTS